MRQQPQYEKCALTLTLEPIYLCSRLNFCLGNVVKYILRAPFKGDYAGDMEKALDYLELQIAAYLDEGYDDRDFISPWSQAGVPEFLHSFQEKHDLLATLFTPEGNTSIDELYKTGKRIERLLHDAQDKSDYAVPCLDEDMGIA